MQLAAADLTVRLRAAACVLLAAGAPAAARAQDSTATAAPKGTTRIEATGLLYGERQRVNVVEPTLRATRLFPSGQSLSAQLGLDVITGASPTGALPTGREPTGVVTTTSPSGNSSTTSPPAANAIPLARFGDTRGALDLEWDAPYGVLTSTLGGHFSRETDYQSAGGSGKLSVDVLQRLATLSVGGGYNYDDVFPTVLGSSPAPATGGEGGIGGERLQGSAALVDATVPNPRRNFVKRTFTGLAGISAVLTRRWIVGVNVSRMQERGYLTEPYKVVSVQQPDSGTTIGAYKENRPSARDRRAVLASTVYHFARDVLHLSYRYYWDDWNVRSNTVDAAYRRDLPNDIWVEPHLRAYHQTGAWFWTPGLIQGAPLPEFATADQRVGPLSTGTVGVTVGFKVPNSPGEWTVRAEYLGQIGERHPAGVTGVQQGYDLSPRLDIGTLVVGWTYEY